jgi:uncharacterized membrane protein YgdD (TMEM256/DUF423 family)
MNRRLLFLGVFLSVIAVVASTSILFLKGASNDPESNLVFTIAVQLNLFHAVLLFVLAWVKRKYDDKNLIITGWIFTFSILIFSGTAYFSMLSETGVILFNTIGVIGVIGLLVGWIALSKEFYDIFVPRRQ